MAKILVLAEKPSVGRDIARVIGCKKGGQGFIEGPTHIVTWALGHLVTLADPDVYDKKYKHWNIEDLPIIPKKIKLTIINSTKKQFNVIKFLLQRTDISEVVIATDAGREGELVARLILKQAGALKSVKRLWISSVTDKAIRAGFNNLKNGKEYDNLYNAAMARANADWIVGINATRALTTKYNASLSCGRVQTPTLAMIFKRCQDIKSFKSRTYYSVKIVSDSISYNLDKKETIFDESICTGIIENIQGIPGEVSDIKRIFKKTSPSLLYDLTNLQADANKLFDFSAKETLDIAQSLYERHKVLTYPRTDSRYLTSDILDTLHERIKACNTGKYRRCSLKLADKRFDGSERFVNNNKVTDHHAIIPTEQQISLTELTVKEQKIYELVVCSFLSAMYPDYEYEELTIYLKIGDYNFKAKANKTLNLGYKEVAADDNIDKDKLKSLERLKKGQKINIDSIELTKSKTSPPSYFNEATLVLAMENPSSFIEGEDKSLAKTLKETGGIGTVATRADIIEKLFNSFLIEKKGKEIYITDKGVQLLGLVPSELRSPELTARWEQRLKNISKGVEKIDGFLDEISAYTQKIIEAIKTSQNQFKHTNISYERCPVCNKFMLNINGKKGRMLVCSDRECGYRKNVASATNIRCPNCKKRLEIVGDGKKRKLICPCGFRENYQAFEKRRGDLGNKLSKREVASYISNQDKDINNPFADLFKDIKL